MAYGIRKLRELQLAREATAGTAGTPDILWRGPVQMPEDTRNRVFVEENVGQRDPTGRYYDAALQAIINMPEQPATFDQLVHVLEAGITEETPAQDGTGGYQYAYVLNAAANDPKTYTMRGGDNSDVLEAEYCFVTQFELSGRVDEAVMLTAAWEGRQVEDASLETLSPSSVEEILFNQGKIYIDDSGGTIGTTEKAGSLLGFRLVVQTGWRAVRGADGNLYFYAIKNVGGMATLELTLEHDAVATAERAAMRSGSVRLVRLQFDGSTIAGGSNFSGKALRIDFEGKWQADSFRTLEDENGDDIVTGTLRHQRDTGNDDTGVQITLNIEDGDLDA
jgi:hypothetical protein